MLGWDRYEFHEKHVGIRYSEFVFLHLVGYVAHVVHSGASGANHRRIIFHARAGQVRIQQKAHRGTLQRTCVFEFRGIYGSCSAFCCIWATTHRRTIFHARLGLIQIPQKAQWDTLHQICVFASDGICRSPSAFRNV
jgi:hypothetical protein